MARGGKARCSVLSKVKTQTTRPNRSWGPSIGLLGRFGLRQLKGLRPLESVSPKGLAVASVASTRVAHGFVRWNKISSKSFEDVMIAVYIWSFETIGTVETNETLKLLQP